MSSADSILNWARANSGIISVAGALIIFFSWVVTNTLGQRYSRTKAATETAQATFRLYTTLHEQRNQLNSIAMEVIQRSESGLNASILSPAKTADPMVNQARLQYSLTRLSAHQIKELMDFTAETFSLSRSVGRSSSAGTAIEVLLKEVEALHRNLLQHERTAEDAINVSKLPPDQLLAAVESYSDYFRGEAIPRVPRLYERIVALSNERQKEASEYLDISKRQAERAGAISIFLYIVGSCLALVGQAIEKTKPKEEVAEKPAHVAPIPSKAPEPTTTVVMPPSP